MAHFEVDGNYLSTDKGRDRVILDAFEADNPEMLRESLGGACLTRSAFVCATDKQANRCIVYMYSLLTKEQKSYLDRCRKVCQEAACTYGGKRNANNKPSRSQDEEGVLRCSPVPESVYLVAAEKSDDTTLVLLSALGIPCSMDVPMQLSKRQNLSGIAARFNSETGIITKGFPYQPKKVEAALKRSK
jgi:hypothetical protein